MLINYQQTFQTNLMIASKQNDNLRVKYTIRNNNIFDGFILYILNDRCILF